MTSHHPGGEDWNGNSCLIDATSAGDDDDENYGGDDDDHCNYDDNDKDVKYEDDNANDVASTFCQCSYSSAP